MSAFPAPGGSVLVCWKFDDAPHGYVKEFNIATAAITAQLEQMYANGQRRLGIAVPYFAIGDTFALDCRNGELEAQDEANLAGLIEVAKQIGFGELLIEMIPEWSASYANWANAAVMSTENEPPRTFQPLDYSRDFEFTLAVDNVVRDANIPYRMDLIGEGADVEVCSRFWSDWCDISGGTDGSVGFSMMPVQASIDNYAKIYTNGFEPPVLSVHAYNGPGAMDWPSWKAATVGWTQGYIIGESLCNSPAADQIFASSPDRYFYRLVWPLTANGLDVTQNCLTVDQKF